MAALILHKKFSFCVKKATYEYVAGHDSGSVLPHITKVAPFYKVASFQQEMKNPGPKNHLLVQSRLKTAAARCAQTSPTVWSTTGT